MEQDILKPVALQARLTQRGPRHYHYCRPMGVEEAVVAAIEHNDPAPFIDWVAPSFSVKIHTQHFREHPSMMEVRG